MGVDPVCVVCVVVVHVLHDFSVQFEVPQLRFTTREGRTRGVTRGVTRNRTRDPHGTNALLSRSLIMRRVSLNDVRSLTLAALRRVGLNDESSRAIADVVVCAERDGARSHGIFRVPGYCAGIIHGKVNPHKMPVVSKDGGVVRCDAHGGYAPLALRASIPSLADAAKTNGVALLAVTNQFHFHALWWEAEILACEYGLASLSFVSSKAYVAPPGTKRRLYGTNPMAFAFPRGSNRHPLVYDQASSAMARGEIQLMKSTLPDNVGVDRNGRATNDPAEVLRGAQLPFGGHKGANVALMIEILTGATMSPLARDAHGDDPDWYGPTRHGEVIVAIDPSAMSVAPNEERISHIERLFDELREDGARLPGNRRHTRRDMVSALSDENVTVDVPAELLDEISSIANGHANVTQGYERRDVRGR